MSDSDAACLTFAMGDHVAEFPTDRLYVTNHMWASRVGDGDESSVYRFGLTAYAVRLLQDVYFLDWIVDPGASVKDRAQLGSIESKKAESDLYAPLAGLLTEINEALLDDPSTINADTYGEAWMFAMSVDEDQVNRLLTPDGYMEHLTKAWEVAQRTIKGQANV